MGETESQEDKIPRYNIPIFPEKRIIINDDVYVFRRPKLKKRQELVGELQFFNYGFADERARKAYNRIILGTLVEAPWEITEKNLEEHDPAILDRLFEVGSKILGESVIQINEKKKLIEAIRREKRHPISYLFNLCNEFNSLPCSGGVLDQDPVIMDMFSIIIKERVKAEKKQAKEMERERSRMRGRSRRR